MQAIARVSGRHGDGAARPLIGHLAIFALAYAGAAALSEWLRLVPEHTPALWPPSGLYVAALLLSDLRHWPRFIAVAVVAELTVDALLFDFSLGVAVLLAVGNTLEAVIGAALVRRWCGTPYRFEGLREVLALIACAVVLSPAVSATVGAATLAATGSETFTSVWPLWWIGDAVGVLVVAPLVMVVVQHRAHWREVCWTEAAVLLVTLGALGEYVFSGAFPFGYITLLPLMWAALRFGMPGAAVAMALLTAITVRHTAAGEGMFAGLAFDLEQRAFLLQLFIGLVGLSTLVLAAVINQRRVALRALQEAHDRLELRVSERTEALQESEERLRLAAQATGFGTYEYDPLQRLVVSCSQFCAIVGLPEGSQLDREAWLRLLHPDDRERFARSLERALDPMGPARHEIEVRAVRADGEIRWLADTGRSFFASEDGARRAVRLIGTVQDITTRKQAEQELRASEERFRELAEAAPVGVVFSDAQHHCLYVNPEWLEITGLPVDALLGREWHQAAHPDDRSRVLAAVAESALSGGPLDLELRIRRPSGEERWLRARATALRDATGGVTGYVGTHADITETMLAREEIAHENEQVRLLARRLTETQEHERREIARVLHEGLAQDLFALQLGLVPLRDVARGRADAQQIVRDLESLLSQSMRDLKNLSNELRPTALDHLGLVPALERHAEEFSRRSGIAVSVAALAQAPDLPEHAATVVYRAVQEALTNVAKHAVAERVEIEFASDDERFRLTVTDDGRGITQQEVRKAGSLGLLAMTERLRELGGSVVIAGRPGEGSRLTIQVPVACGASAGASDAGRPA